ncbi:hypothetical protein Clacol_009085 [Clathrus columnatus]|uniref:Anaphase-promoting complex subunit 4-like WD40 domain-containing protein n=1 Tax=Clathrus columnatus TaxID=1419009 RepID=A0AAV5AM79_9AGAM|nr:hypothetical protein Clacol_009085 [Clathrus columnatus]
MSSRFIRIYTPNPTTTRGTSTKIVYSEHAHPTTVARFSPSGYYAASADSQGNVRVWDTAGPEKILKSQFKVISGRINDLSWDGESKRIIAVGDGRGKFGHAFQFDTGSSCGEIEGHSKSLNAVIIRNERPFRAATAGDDGTIVFYTGAPYKYQKILQRAHTNFIHTLAYASSGSHFVSAGADYKVFLWDGTSGDQSKELIDVDSKTAHKGTVFAAAWSPDGKSIATSSADCTVKLWDVEAAKSTTTWKLGTGVDHHQVGNTWTSSNLVISLSLIGVLNVFDPRTGDKPIKIIEAPTKSITSGALFDQQPSSYFVGSSDGKIHNLTLHESFDTDPTQGFTHVTGGGHTNLVVDMASGHQQNIWTVALDDKLREISVSGSETATHFSPTVYSLSSQPKSMSASSDGHTFVVEVSSIEVIRGSQKVTSLSLKYQGSSIDIARDGSNIVAVGGEDSKIRLYKWNSNGTLTESGELPEAQKGVITAVAFSPNGELLAAGDSSGKITVYDIKERKVSINKWTNHATRVYSLVWTFDGAHIASASLDTHIYVWDVAKPLKIIAIKNAIPRGAWSVAWVPNSVVDGKGKLLGSGADGAVRVWEVVFH